MCCLRNGIYITSVVSEVYPLSRLINLLFSHTVVEHSKFGQYAADLYLVVRLVCRHYNSLQALNNLFDILHAGKWN